MNILLMPTLHFISPPTLSQNLDVQSVFGSKELLRAFEISQKSRTCAKRRHEQNFQRHGSCLVLKKLVGIKEINCRALRYNQMDLLKVNIRNRITADEMVSAIESAVT